jgi:hypothetical protein
VIKVPKKPRIDISYLNIGKATCEKPTASIIPKRGKLKASLQNQELDEGVHSLHAYSI